MYEAFYNLKEKPFNLTPDPRFIYFTEKHCEALANLVYGIRERKGILVLSGEAGTGKTTLINALLDTLERTSVLSAFIFNPLLTAPEFFEYLLSDLNLKGDYRSKSQALIRLNSLLLDRYRQGQVTVLIIDEAQNLSPEVLEEVRLLTNLETSTEKLLQIVLVGQQELSLKLDSPGLRQLKQRISLRCNLAPLALFETKEYIRTRMEIAGQPDQKVFPDSSITEIHRFSSGIPRLINTICDNALVSGYACEKKIIDNGIIREVAQDLELSEGGHHMIRQAMNARSGAERSNEEESTLHSSSSDPSEPQRSKYDPEAFHLFVKFVDKLRERG
jgi:general secretion pathway protein A